MQQDRKTIQEPKRDRRDGRRRRNRLKAFCEVMQIEQEHSGRADLEAKMDKLLDELGADFKAAWETAGSIDPTSDDGKVLDAALDQLSDKCP
jgi:hypothetical protein